MLAIILKERAMPDLSGDLPTPEVPIKEPFSEEIFAVVKKNDD